MRPSHTFSYRDHPSVVIVEERALARARRGHLGELARCRYVHHDVNVTDVMHQQHWSPGRYEECELSNGHRSTPPETFGHARQPVPPGDRAGRRGPAPGQLSLRGVS